MMSRHSIILALITVTLCPSSDSQGIILPGLGNIWELGNSPFNEACLQTGNPGLEPVFGTDPWFFNFHCVTHQGSVGCVIEDPELGYGMCRCNQGNSSYFTSLEDSEGTQMCVGKVGAFCSAEQSWFFLDKICTTNAYCQPTQLGQGRKVGKCQCLYGFYTTHDGYCEKNKNIPIGIPPKEDLKLPPLNLLIGVHEVSYQEDCYPNPVVPLNRTICNTFGGTVACLKNVEDRLQCQCNQQTDSIFDEELSMCVGRVGSYCLARKWVLGYKACSKNADCEIEEGTSFDEGYSFGKCSCVYGYKPTDNGLCERDNSIPYPSTSRPGPTMTTRIISTTLDISENSTSNGKGK